MVPHLRQAFNEHFTVPRYKAFLDDLNSLHPGQIDFRVAETPVFISKSFRDKLLHACESIVDVICSNTFKAMTEQAIPAGEKVPAENGFPHMISFDFGVCESETGALEPQLIEMQGFPTLYAFQVFYPEVLRRHFEIPEHYSHYLSGYSKESYLNMLRNLLLGSYAPEEVVLLEIKPNDQKTRIDFYCTRDYTGIQTVCITELIREGNALYYLRAGQKTRIRRIYNRIIFDDFKVNKESLGDVVDITSDYDVEWIPHPNWFYRISKYTLPFVQHPFVPETYFLHELKQLPGNLEDFVLKPLFSFAGQGVLIDVIQKDIDAITDPQHYILQRKVKYADIIPTPDVPAKVEIRIMYVWPEGATRPHAAINLARLSKGKMIGVRYNKDKEWVGGSVAFFEQ